MEINWEWVVGEVGLYATFNIVMIVMTITVAVFGWPNFCIW